MALIVIIAIVLFITILSILIILIIIDQNNQKESIVDKNKIPKDLDSMIKMAKDRSVKESILKELAIVFINTQKLTEKKAKEADEQTKHKLNFISALASNTNTSPKLVSFLNNELCKRYPSYKTEINTYEKMGLARRNSNEDN